MIQNEESVARDADVDRVDALSDEFERALKAGPTPRIEDYLSRIGPSSRPMALRELLKVEVELRRRRHEPINEQEYIERFPDFQAIVAEICRQSDVLLASAERITANRPARHDTTVGDGESDSEPSSGRLEVRCPNCHQPTEVAVDTLLTDLTCSSCGSHFRLVDQGQATRMAPALSKLGRFDLIERIGVGGFGSVWKARDKELDRTVAVKIPRAGGMTPEEQEKFFREARAAAQLRHPNIVSVHEVGRDGDNVYIVSDFVRGVTLGDWLTGQQLTSREAAELCAKIADALDHAHEQGVVHRDMKPANIMIDGDGHPHLMDFGLARRDAGEVTVTIDGQVLGTPAYMSPEQAQGEAHQADRRSDVYSLGAILFQLLTGELPFRGNARMLMHQVIHDEPPSPRKFNASIPKDLETITLKCLAKSPAARYQTGRELAEDLRRFLHNEPIVARPVPKWERAAKWIRRHPAPSALVVTFCVAILSGIVGLTWHTHSLKRSQEVLKENNRRLEEARHQANLATANARDVARFLIGGFESADPIHFGSYSFGNAPTQRAFDPQTFLDRGRKYLHEDKLDLDPDLRAKLLNAIGGAYAGSGRLNEAYASLSEALQIREKLDANARTRELASTLHNLGFLSFLFGRYAEAETHLRNALAIEKYLAANNLGQAGDIISTKFWLAATLLETQRGPEIKQLLEEVVAARSPELKAYDRDFAIAAFGLALVSARLGDFDAAMSRYNQAKSILKESSGDELAEALDLVVSSVFQSVLGDDRGAAKTIEQALSTAARIVGGDHPILHVMRIDLAESYQRMGNPEKAKEQLENSLQGARRLFGNRPRTAGVLYHLGDVMCDLNQVDKAVETYNEALHMLDENLDQYDVAEVTHRLGMIALLEKRVADARPLFQTTIDFEKHLRPGMQHPVMAYGHIGLAITDTADNDQYQRELNKAEQILRKLPADVPRVVAQLGSVGDMFQHAGMSDRAEILYAEAVKIHGKSAQGAETKTGMLQSLLTKVERSMAPRDGYPVGRVQAGLGRCLLAKAHIAEARPHLEKAARIYADQLGPNDSRTIEMNTLLSEH